MANPDHSANGQLRREGGEPLEVIERGWSLDDWEAWVAESTAALLLRDAEADV